MSNTAPRGLDAAGRKLWRSVTKDHTLRPDEARVLEDACREADIIEFMETERQAPGFKLIVRGSMGQDVINPLISELRQHRTTLNTLLKTLKLSDDAAETRSSMNRRAANARWGLKAVQ